MPRFCAFLRGMNLGGRRLRNDELCEHVGRLGFADVRAFLASGNVVFDAREADPEAVARRLEDGLARALDYEVPTFVRTAEEIRDLAGRRPFGAKPEGKPQVAFLKTSPSPDARDAVLGLATDRDHLEFSGRELHWLPADGVSGTGLDWREVERHVGTTTVRTERTVERLAAKFF